MKHNWNRRIKGKIETNEVEFLIFLEPNHDHDDTEMVRINTMLNEYFLTDLILCQDRDFAYAIIQNFPLAVLEDRFFTIAVENGAVELSEVIEEEPETDQ